MCCTHYTFMMWNIHLSFVLPLQTFINSAIILPLFLFIGTLLGEGNVKDDGRLGQHQLQFDCLQRLRNQHPVFRG